MVAEGGTVLCVSIGAAYGSIVGATVGAGLFHTSTGAGETGAAVLGAALGSSEGKDVGAAVTGAAVTGAGVTVAMVLVGAAYGSIVGATIGTGLFHTSTGAGEIGAAVLGPTLGS